VCVSLSVLIMGAVLTLWLLKSNSAGWRDGVRHGASIGLMIWLGVNILYFGWDGGSLRLHLIDSAIEGIRWGGAGGVVGLILGSKSVRARVGL